jgi:hypothetical protein
MYMLPKDQSDLSAGYWGYIVAQSADGNGVCGMHESDDGLRWRQLPPPEVEWDGFEPHLLELGGCERLDGRYYLWYLNGGRPASLSLATSTDGVYWREEGYTFLPDEDANFGMGEAEVYRFDQDGPFVKIYTSSGISFATSEDLLHWNRLGKEFDLHLDRRWYTGRWDSLFILPRPEGGWMALFNTRPKDFRGLGFAVSQDGLRWDIRPPARVEVPYLEDSGIAGEISGWAKLQVKYFMTSPPRTN